MKTIEMKKIIKSRSNGVVKNYSKIKNIEWTKIKGIGKHQENNQDDCVYFDYDNEEYMLLSKYTAEHSALQSHTVIKIEASEFLSRF